MQITGVGRVQAVQPLRPTERNEQKKRYSDETDVDIAAAEAEKKKAAEELRKKQEQEQQKKQQEQEQKMLKEQLESSKKEAKSMEDMFEAFAKCLKIASRISRGDIVPMKDIKFLAEHEPDLYKQAILLRVPNPEPKKHKSLIDDEDEETDTGFENTQTDMPDASAAGEAPSAAERAPEAEEQS